MTNIITTEPNNLLSQSAPYHLPYLTLQRKIWKRQYRHWHLITTQSIDVCSICGYWRTMWPYRNTFELFTDRTKQVSFQRSWLREQTTDGSVTLVTSCCHHIVYIIAHLRKYIRIFTLPCTRVVSSRGRAREPHKKWLKMRVRPKLYQALINITQQYNYVLPQSLPQEVKSWRLYGPVLYFMVFSQLWTPLSYIAWIYSLVMWKNKKKHFIILS